MHCNQSPLISIIIPVYQVEKYLDKCIASIVNQTYQNLEIILVDDGSSDNCPAICDTWKEWDPRINVIHQKNGGLSHARNEGLKIGTGEFIGFVDSDDWIEPNMYELLLTALFETDADIAVCDYLNESGKTQSTILIEGAPVRKTFTAEEALKLLLYSGNNICIAVWNKLYRRSTIGNFQFPEGKFYEDVCWTPQIIGRSKAIISIDSPLYHYLSRTDSLSNCGDNLYKKYKDSIELNEHRIQYYHENYPSLENLAIAKYQIDCCLNYTIVNRCYKQFDTKEEICRIIHCSFCKWGWTKTLILCKCKVVIGCLVFRFCPILFSHIYIILSKLWGK